MAQAQINTNMDTVVVNVENRPPYDPTDFSPMKFKYIGNNPSGDAENDVKPTTTVFGITFVQGEATEVKDPRAKWKLLGNPHFEAAGKKESRVPEDSTVDPEAQGPSAEEGMKDARRGEDYEVMRDAVTVLDLPNPLSKEQQKLEDEADREAGRPTIAEAGEKRKPGRPKNA